jgi:hypothetical protein
MLKKIRHLSAAVVMGCAAISAVSALPTVAAAQEVSAQHISLYRDLMEANGTTPNIRNVIATTRATTTQTLMDRKGSPLTAEERAHLDRLFARILGPVEEQIVDSIARFQAPQLTEADISQLILARRSPAAVLYEAERRAGSPEETAAVTAFMVDAVVSIIKVFRGDGPHTAASTPPDDADAALRQRISLTRHLLDVDGTAEITANFLNNVYRPLISAEVSKYIEISSLSEPDRARLAAITAIEQQTLTDRILDQSATRIARRIGRSDIATLIATYDTDAERNLTALRLSDDGSLDAAAGQALQAASTRIIAEFEARK